MSEHNIWTRKPDETEDAYLWRIGSLKEAGLIALTWDQLAIILNSATNKSLNESTWRKRFAALLAEAAMKTEKQAEEIKKPMGKILKMDTVWHGDPLSPEEPSENEEPENAEEIEDEELDEFNADKALVRIRDERFALNRLIRSDARRDAVLDLFKSEIHRYDKKKPPKPSAKKTADETAIYALLSDVHYGIAYNTSVGAYNSDIARERVMNYAEKIVEIGAQNGAQTCYVSLLGDMVSGIIHAPIRIENRENAVEQVIGVSELVADFLYRLSESFVIVYVNAVPGNHSRLDMSAENALRAEKLDNLIPWYCKAKLEKIDNVFFVENAFDATVCMFNILGKNFIGVHGDIDKDLTRSATKIERSAGYPVDYIVAGHMHVPDIRMEDRGYIRNGSVCGSGDEYTMKNRLFSNPSQVCMTVTADGVQSVWPIAV